MKFSYHIIIFLLFGCSSSNDKTVTKKDTDTIPQQIQKRDSIVQVKRNFDYEKFTLLADSLVTLIADENIDLLCKIDTTTKINVNIKGGYQKYFLADKGSVFIYYRFLTGKKRPYLSFRVMHALFKDNKSLNKAFINLRMDADSMYRDTTHSAYNFSPGLTYENDYVLKTNEQIIWLNLPCPYSQKNISRMKTIFKQCLSIGLIKDSIICWCGQGKCDK